MSHPDPAKSHHHVPLELVKLDQDHPGFRDATYRRRRNEIAALAIAHEIGDPVTPVVYTPEEHCVWATALEHLAPLHARWACREHLAQWPTLAFPADRIPTFDEVNAKLAATTGFSLAPVAGLVSPKEFMSTLAEGVFLATQYMRHHSAPLYTPEPDIIHELVGHAALLSHPEFARINRRFGEATLAADDAEIQQLIRVYWYALEFGLVHEGGALKAIGAGLLSSYGELGRFEQEAKLRPFVLAEVAATPFDPTRYQDTLFVAQDRAGLLGELDAWLGGIIA